MKTLSRMLLTFAAVLFLANLTFSQNTAKTQDVQKAKTTVSSTQGKFVDANKNGVCDNFEARGKSVKGKGNCCGQGHQHRHGKGNGNCCGKGLGNGNGSGCGYKSK